MSNSYIPTRQQELRDYAVSTAGHLSADPGRFGLMTAEAASVQERVDEFSDSLDRVLDPATRNVGTIEAKNLARVSMLQLLRPVLQRIRDNQGVALEDKRLLNLRDPDTQPTPAPVPTSVPVLEVQTLAPLVHTLRYHDQATPERRARPAGTAALQLFRSVNPATPPAGPDEADFVAVVTRQPFRLQYDSAEALKMVYYWARWQNTRGQVGPWSIVAVKAIAA